ncbi:MAG: hypothetical protein ACTSXD_08515 [Candidatus Heimdallarchaeaceae archaeon]
MYNPAQVNEIPALQFLIETVYNDKGVKAAAKGIKEIQTVISGNSKLTQTYTKVLDKNNKVLSQTSRIVMDNRKKFQMYWLSFMFAGMQIKRVAEGIIRSTSQAYMKITEGTTLAGMSVLRLGIHFQYLQISIGEAIAEFVNAYSNFLIPLIDWIADFIQQHPVDTVLALFGAFALGFALFSTGQAMLFINSLTMFASATIAPAILNLPNLLVKIGEGFYGIGAALMTFNFSALFAGFLGISLVVGSAFTATLTIVGGFFSVLLLLLPEIVKWTVDVYNTFAELHNNLITLAAAMEHPAELFKYIFAYMKLSIYKELMGLLDKVLQWGVKWNNFWDSVPVIGERFKIKGIDTIYSGLSLKLHEIAEKLAESRNELRTAMGEDYKEGFLPILTGPPESDKLEKVTKFRDNIIDLTSILSGLGSDGLTEIDGKLVEFDNQSKNTNKTIKEQLTPTINEMKESVEDVKMWWDELTKSIVTTEKKMVKESLDDAIIRISELLSTEGEYIDNVTRSLNSQTAAVISLSNSYDRLIQKKKELAEAGGSYYQYSTSIYDDISNRGSIRTTVR